MVTYPPKVFLVGPSGAGKTSLRPFLCEWLSQRGSQVAVLGFDEAQRHVCPPDILSTRYHYDSHGALILHERVVQVQMALTRLFQLCKDAAEKDGFVAEIGHWEVEEVLLDFGQDLLQGALVLHVSAPLGLRLNRNRTRGAAWIPDEVVISMPDSLSSAGSDKLGQLGASIQTVDTTEPLATVRKLVGEILERHYTC